MNRLIYASLMIIAIGALSGCGSGGSGQQQGQNKPKPIAAKVLTMKAQPLTLDKSYPSLLRSRQQVRVVARINGFLQNRYYQEGAYVKKGQKLFTIEPAPYRAQVEQRQANLASARANEHNAQRNWNRISTLYKRNAVSQQERDNALSTLEMRKAAVKQAKAALDDAQITFAYTQVNAPVAGMISLRDVNVGNLVQAGTQLATITPLDPIQARFSLPVQDAAALRAQHQEPNAPQVTARITPEIGKPITGKVDFLGSQVDEQTSTVQARATFNNPHHALIPGQFVQVSLQHLRLPQILAVPQVVVTEGQEGPQVYTLDKNNKVKPVSIDTGTITDDNWIVVTNGLKSGDRVVVDHIAKINAGTPINPQPANMSPNGRDQGGNHGGSDQQDGGQKGAGQNGNKQAKDTQDAAPNKSKFARLGRSLEYAEKASLNLERSPVRAPDGHDRHAQAEKH